MSLACLEDGLGLLTGCEMEFVAELETDCVAVGGRGVTSAALVVG